MPFSKLDLCSDASFPLPDSHAQGKPSRCPDRLAPADAPGRARAANLGRHLCLVAGRFSRLAKNRADRAGRAGRHRRAGAADAHDPAGGTLARKRALRFLRQRNAAHSRPARPRAPLRPRQSVRSYRELPQIVYHIQWKFRDEVRPRFGVMRGREFLMKDAYSFDLDYAGAVVSYRKMMLAYMRTFQRMGLRAIPMEAETGPIGGDLSHEFIILAPTGESEVFYDAAFEEIDYSSGNFDGQSPADLERFASLMTANYAATDEKHDREAWARVAPERRREGRGIEVGHIFYFGTKYTASMNMSVAGPDGRAVHPEMGSYGIGVSRLVGALIEANHDEAGIVWPDAVAPFTAAILNLKTGDAACDGLAEELYRKLGGRALYDDREERAGVKFADADLMGHPWQIIIGPRGAAKGLVELKRRASGERA